MKNSWQNLKHKAAWPPIRSIVNSIGRLSLSWLKKDYPYRKKALRRLVGQSGFTPKMSEALLDSIFKQLTAPKLWQLLEAELGDPLFLDDFRIDKLTGKRIRARGPGVITHIFSANVPNPAILSFVFGMLLKSVNLGKVSSKDPGFLDIYLESLKETDAELAERNFLIDPKDREILRKAMSISDLVVAYGNDATLARIQKEVSPGVSFMGFGHRMSFGFYLKEALTKKNLNTLAQKTAKDIWLVDRRGCLSPLAIYVGKGGEVSPGDFSQALSRELGKLSVEKWKRQGFAIAARKSLLEDYQRIMKIKTKRPSGGYSGAGEAWTVVCNETILKIPSFADSRLIHVRAFSDVKDVLKALSVFGKFLQAVSLEGRSATRGKIAEALSGLGVNRICRAGSLQLPPLHWHHDGKFNLASWVRWTDLES